MYTVVLACETSLYRLNVEKRPEHAEEIGRQSCVDCSRGVFSISLGIVVEVTEDKFQEVFLISFQSSYRSPKYQR